MELKASIDALRELTDAKFDAIRIMITAESDKAILALRASERAVTKSETAMEKRFEGVNEFRGQLSDQANTFATRENVELRATQNRERIDSLTDSNRKLIEEGLERIRVQMADLQGQSSRLLIALMSTIIGTLLGALVVIWVNHI